MALTFAPGDDLVFQVESGFGLMRVLAVEGTGRETVWHILVYGDFYPDVESAEAARRAPRQPARRGRRTRRPTPLATGGRRGSRPLRAAHARHALMRKDEGC